MRCKTTHRPALHAVALLSADESLAKDLGKGGAMDVALGIFQLNCDKARNHAIIRHATKLIANLLQTNPNIARFVCRQGMRTVLLALVDWGE